MRHYFGYRADGTLASVETYSGGWPQGVCMADLGCDHPTVTNLRAVRAQNNPEIVGFVAYDCDCPSDEETCDCINDKFAGHCVNIETKQFVAKPTTAVFVGGTQVLHGETVTRPPGAAVKLKVVSPDSPDGATLSFATKGPVEISLESQITLTFTHGETQEITLVAPAQGSKGTAFITGKLARPFAFSLRGFAV